MARRQRPDTSRAHRSRRKSWANAPKSPGAFGASDANSAIWQDVYHVPHGSLVLYVKFTTDIEGYLVISFKEK